MTSAKQIPVWIMIAVAGVAAAGLVFLRRYPAIEAPKHGQTSLVEPEQRLPRPMIEQPAAPAEPAPLPPPALAVAAQPAAPAQPTPPATSFALRPPVVQARVPQSTKPDATRGPADAPVGPVPLPLARMALSLVGDDPLAESIWYEAINDPNTSAHDRQDLIEDLNEEGFADPSNITLDDLPLIENRIALIEEVAAEAMDDVNAAAFAEAYKDLVNMWIRLNGQNQ